MPDNIASKNAEGISIPGGINDQPRSKKGLIIVLVLVALVVGAAGYLSTKTELLRGTVEVGQDQARQEYVRKLEAAKSLAEEQQAEAEYIRKVVEILEK